jgi:hypothetical protein
MATILRRVCSGITQVVLAAMLLPAASAAPPAASEPAATPTRPAPRPPPRLLSHEEKRLSSVEPGQLRPVQRTVPQVRIPLGQRAAAEGERPERTEGTRPLRRAPAPTASAPGHIDDEAARCEAQTSKEAARACRLLTTPKGKGRAG